LNANKSAKTWSFLAVPKGNSDDSLSTRRDFWKSVGATSAAGAFLTLTTPLPAQAAKKMSQEEKDKENIVKGYQRLTYFLDNWEKETSNCKKAKSEFDGCERTPEKVMDYIGYKSIEDPLFRADKTLVRLEPLVPEELESEFLEAYEKYVENSEAANGTAFVSSWGEANPGGGKDRIVLFLERSKANVIACQESLAVVIRVLDLKV